MIRGDLFIIVKHINAFFTRIFYDYVVAFHICSKMKNIFISQQMINKACQFVHYLKYSLKVDFRHRHLFTSINIRNFYPLSGTSYLSTV